jgi:uncharacterized protein YjbI with pentapeptide repeats
MSFKILSTDGHEIFISQKATVCEAAQEALARGAFWRAKQTGLIPDLSNLDLSRIDFCDSNLNHVTLSRSLLEWAFCQNVSLVEANLRESRWTEADLSGANLSGADLTDADFSGADLSQVRLVKANLKGAHFNSTNLTGADLTGATLTDADFSQAILAGTIFADNKISAKNLLRALGVNFQD